MAKVEVKAEKTEIIRQVRLTTNQRLQLVKMSNEGGRASHVDWGIRTDLIALGLIEERDRYTVKERVAMTVEVASLWKQAAPLLRSKNADALDRIVDAIRAKEREYITKGFWLTEAANEYLTKGRVVITR